MNIYVGNLSYSVTEDELREMFAEFGEVTSVTLVKDNYTQESKGFGFVEMEKQNAAEEAIKKLNGNSIKGRSLKVNLARPKGDRGKSRSRSW